VYWAEQDTDGVFELYCVPSDGPATASVKISGPLVENGDVSWYKISPDSARVVYVADQQVDGTLELYSVPIAGPADAWVKLNGPLVSQGWVDNTYEITADGSRVVYRAVQLIADTNELFSVPIEGPASLGERINGTLVSGGRVVSFRVSPNGSRVVYRADQDVDEFYELYSVPVVGPASTAAKINHAPAADGRIHTFAISPDGGRVVYCVTDQGIGVALHSVPTDGPPGQSVKITKDLDPGGHISSLFKISPDSAHVVSLGIQTIPGDSEVFSVPITGPPTEWKRLNRTLGSGEYLIAGADDISPDSSRVIYRANQFNIFLGENRLLLYSVPIDGPGTASIRLNGATVDGCEVEERPRFAPDSEHVVYLADQDTDEVSELYVSYDKPTAARNWHGYE